MPSSGDPRDARIHVLTSGSEADVLSTSAVTTVKLSANRLLWIDVDLAAGDAGDLLAAVAQRADLGDEEVSRLLKPRGKPSADDHDELLRVEVVGLNEAGDQGPSDVTCLVGDGWVATAHEGDPEFIGE